MSEPLFLSVAQVEVLHNKSISRFGGTHGVRDRGLFESAISQPRHTFYYGQGDLFDVAAAYAFHIAEAKLVSTETSGQALLLLSPFSI